VVSKHQLGAPRLCWAKHPNKRGWPIITGLWLATAWVLGRAGHIHLSKHARSLLLNSKEVWWSSCSWARCVFGRLHNLCPGLCNVAYQ
jgi:hypothetical protein